ncbi:MAG: ROK family protein [Clostridiales bacterium]|nr:ROK family protein [Clostridiales bacterium]
MGTKLGIDIGGTNIKFAVVEGDCVKYKSSVKTERTCEGIIEAIAKEANSIKEQFNIKKVGVGTPGIIKNGMVTSVNLPFENTNLEKLLKERLGLPVTVDNDANCAALGEIEFGTTKECDNIVLVSLGTGVGGGIIMNRQICHGNNNMGEIGHIIIQTEGGRKCPCGLCGCWEQYASATALIKDAQAAALENKESVLYGLMEKNSSRLDGKLIFEALDQGCETAKAVFDKYIFYLASGIESLVNIFGPDAVVLAGGVTKQGDKLLAPLKEKLRGNIRIEISELQSDAGALGAAML